ncbi:MAG: sigma-70 family RNA polymerase sigma factor [Nocardioidaceae bacterium]
MAAADDTDADLVRAMAGADEDALRQLFERHAGWITARLARRCSDRDAVADALQDTFVAAWKGAHGYRADGEVPGWLWGIAMRRLVSRLRRHGASVALGPALLERDQPDVAAEEQLLLTMEYADLGPALSRISPELRIVLQVVVLDGLTTREAASLLRIPQGTVKTRLMRARTRLREELA